VGVNGTPTIFINGRSAGGASVEAQKKIVDFEASQK
jgi:protein-disulfide isomerase